MEAEFKSTKRCVPRRLWHLPKIGQNWTFGLKSVVFNHFSGYV